MQISSLIKIKRGVTALIGGGGKTTLMYTLAEELRTRGSVLLCTSTHILIPDHYPVITSKNDLQPAISKHGAVCMGTPAENGKLTAPSVSFNELVSFADYVLVEADGAKRLPLKAHAPYEPVIPDIAKCVVLVVGADGFGRPVSEVCHRAERWAELAGVSIDSPATPESEARVIISEGFGNCILINKVESAQTSAAAEELAKRLACPVVAGSLKKGVFTCLR